MFLLYNIPCVCYTQVHMQYIAACAIPNPHIEGGYCYLVVMTSVHVHSSVCESNGLAARIQLNSVLV